jgi:hypothetical protein
MDRVARKDRIGLETCAQLVNLGRLEDGGGELDGLGVSAEL